MKKGIVMKKLVVGMLIILSLLAGCGSKQDTTNDEIDFLEVDLTINPEKAKLGEEVTFSAKVTYGDEAVEDADEVKFEVWRSQSENHEEIVVKHKENGVYELKKSFSEEGTYYVYAHVTARGMHNMPKKEFVIGQPSEPETEDGSHSMKEQHSDKASSDTHNH
jgi:uncharacterized lipoprotein NlpE involved in copper resistance